MRPLREEIKHIRDGLPRRLLGLALALVLMLGGWGFVPAQAEGSGMIRVLLTRLGTPSSVTLETGCAYVLSGNVRLNLPAGTRVTFRAENDGLTAECGGATMYLGAQAQLLRCGDVGVRFISPALSNRFCGDLTLAASGGVIKAVLRLYIEDYLYGVVAYEMSNSYPLEALKAQAVAARNYALQKMASRKGQSYDVTDNTSNQVFKGYNASQSRVIQAVNETRGQALYAGGKLASCYYGASNGGQTESTRNAWGNSLSYSVVKDDPYDLENASAKKTMATIRRDATKLNASLEAALRAGMQNAIAAWGAMAESVQILSIDSITPRDPKYASPSRLYRSLRFKLDVSALHAVSGEKLRGTVQVDVPTYGALENWYSLSINSASNETVSVDSDEKNFYVTFRRWGHGIGMSQRGAQRMAANYGKSCAEILDFYYPGTILKSLSLSNEAAHAPASAPDAAIATARVEAEAQLRASANGLLVACLPAGQKLEVYRVDGAWALVGKMALCGWIKAEELRDFTLASDPLHGVPAEERMLTADAQLMELPLDDARVLDTILAGALVSVTERSELWARIALADGREGYVRANLLGDAEPSMEPSQSPEESASPEITPEPTNTAPEPTNTAPEPTNTAPEPTNTAPEPTNTAPEPTNTAPEPTNTAPAPTWTTLPIPTNTPTASLPTPKPTATFSPQPTVEDRPMPTPKPAPTGAEGMLVATGTLHAYVNVTAGSSLTLRKSPSTSAVAIGYVQRGVRVTVLAFDDDWACVRTEAGVTGFAARAFLYLPGDSGGGQPVAEDVPKQEEEKSGRFTEKKTGIVFCNRKGVTRVQTKLYKTYSTASAALLSVPQAKQVKVMAYNKNWAYVSYGGKKGFVLLKDLKAA